MFKYNVIDGVLTTGVEEEDQKQKQDLRDVEQEIFHGGRRSHGGDVAIGKGALRRARNTTTKMRDWSTKAQEEVTTEEIR